MQTVERRSDNEFWLPPIVYLAKGSQFLDHIDAILVRHLIVDNYGLYGLMRRCLQCGIENDLLCGFQKTDAINKKLGAVDQAKKLEVFFHKLDVQQSVVCHKYNLLFLKQRVFENIFLKV